MNKKHRILVVDDDVDISQAISRALKAKGYDVVVAYNGEEGLKKAREEKPDLMLLDIMMPVMDGFTVAQLLNKDKVLSKIPVLALTSFSESLGQPFEFKVSEYIRKPIRSKDLIAIVEKHLKVSDD